MDIQIVGTHAVMPSKCLQVQVNLFWRNISAPKTLLIAVFAILVGYLCSFLLPPGF
jgi:hypothetical protein